MTTKNKRFRDTWEGRKLDKDKRQKRIKRFTKQRYKEIGKALKEELIILEPIIDIFKLIEMTKINLEK